MPDDGPTIAEQLKARYGTDYPGFTTLDQVDKIMVERMRYFFGRNDQLAILDAFVGSNQRGIMLIAAPGGFGKSALLANWSVRRARQGAAIACHFFNATASRTTQRTDALRGLLVQIAFLRGRPAPTLPDHSAKLEDLLNQELCQAAVSERPLIVILDGLDEAAELIAPMAPAGLGRHVYVFASGRAELARRPERLGLWLIEASRVAYPIVRHDVPQLSVGGVLAWVRGLVPGLSADQEARLAQRLAAASERVPLFLRYIIDDIRDRHARGEELSAIVESLGALPTPFTEYAAQQILAMRDMQRHAPGSFNVDVASVFALLTLVKEALPLDELQDVLGARLNPWDFDPRITRWFADRSAGEERAIAFLDPVLSDVFRKALGEVDSTAGLLGDMRSRLIEHCRASWSKGSLYALTNLPWHQIEAGRVRDAIATLTDLAFLDARLGHAEAPRLIARTLQDFEAADGEAPADLRPETRARRSFWATVEQHLIGLARGPQAGRAPEALRQLLRDDSGTTRHYETRHGPWVQTSGGRGPQPLLRELKGHSGSVLGAKALADGRLLSWGGEGTLRLWASDGTALAELKGHSGQVNAAIALSDGRLLSWSTDGTLRLWASDGAEVAELKGHGRSVNGAMALNDERLLSWSDDETLRLWASDGAELAELKFKIYLDSLDRLMKSLPFRMVRYVYRMVGYTDDRAPINTGHRGPVNGATTLSDGRLLSWSADGTLRLWGADGKPLKELKGHSRSVTGAMALSDGRVLSWSDDGMLRLWASDGKALAELKGHSHWMHGAMALSDGRLLSWSADGTLRLWAANGTELAELRGHGSRVRGALALSDGRLLSWGDDGTLRLWTFDGKGLVELKGHGGPVNGARALSDGRLLSWSADGTLRLWTFDGKAPLELKGHGGPVNGARALSDGRLLSWSADGTLRLWASEGTALSEPRGHTSRVQGTLVLSDGRLLSWSEEGMLRLWASDGKALAELGGHSSRVLGALALSDGRLLSWSADGTLRLWTADGAELAQMEGHRSWVRGALALSDGRLLSWGDDGTLRLWTANGAALAEMKGHTGTVEGATALSDGRLLSWSRDGTLRLWASDGGFLSLWLWPYAGVTRVIPHPDRPNVYWVIAGNDVLQVRHHPANAVTPEQASDIFLSYAGEDAEVMQILHADLTAAGFSAWYDKNIVAGERFDERIEAAIDAAKAVVVLWSQASVRSDYVRYEAGRAHEQGKLVPLLLPPLTTREVPAPYSAVLQIVPHGDLSALKLALELKGAKPN